MSKAYSTFTTYKDAEDLKRLDFIVHTIQSNVKPGAKLLDVGCGNGNISLALGSLGYTVMGVDIDPTSVAKARKLNSFQNVQFDLLDANAFQLKEQFDGIICSEVLEHLTNPSELVNSIYAILKTGGVFVATVPNGWGPREVLITKPMQWLHRKGMDGFMLKIKKFFGYGNFTLQSSNPDLTHVQFFKAGAFTILMHTSGFTLSRWQNADFIERVFPYSWFTRRIYALQKLDCAVANYLPRGLTSGFYTAWKKVDTTHKVI